jgi:hypothetical protein
MACAREIRENEDGIILRGVEVPIHFITEADIFEHVTPNRCERGERKHLFLYTAIVGRCQPRTEKNRRKKEETVEVRATGWRSHDGDPPS